MVSNSKTTTTHVAASTANHIACRRSSALQRRQFALMALMLEAALILAFSVFAKFDDDRDSANNDNTYAAGASKFALRNTSEIVPPSNNSSTSISPSPSAWGSARSETTTSRGDEDGCFRLLLGVAAAVFVVALALLHAFLNSRRIDAFSALALSAMVCAFAAQYALLLRGIMYSGGGALTIGVEE